jgi:hypothetical protein
MREVAVLLVHVSCQSQIIFRGRDTGEDGELYIRRTCRLEICNYNLLKRMD